MTPRAPLSAPLGWLSAFGLLALYQCCFNLSRDRNRAGVLLPSVYNTVANSADLVYAADHSDNGIKQMTEHCLERIFVVLRLDLVLHLVLACRLVLDERVG